MLTKIIVFLIITAATAAVLHLVSPEDSEGNHPQNNGDDHE